VEGRAGRCRAAPRRAGPDRHILFPLHRAGLLVAHQERCAEIGSAPWVATQRQVLGPIEITGLIELVDIAETVQDALNR
jgi:hypothetical protein